MWRSPIRVLAVARIYACGDTQGSCWLFASFMLRVLPRGPMFVACIPWQAATCRRRLSCRGSLGMLGGRFALLLMSRAFMLVVARKLTTTREILLWMTPSEAPKALQASECSELLDPMRASCWISAQH